MLMHPVYGWGDVFKVLANYGKNPFSDLLKPIS